TSEMTGLLEVGLWPASSTALADERHFAPEVREQVATLRRRAGLGDISGGSTLVEIDGRPATLAVDLVDAVAASNGRPITLAFAGRASGGRHETTITPRPRFGAALVSPRLGAGPFLESHVLGLTPALRVEGVEAAAAEAGLRAGDVFARVGSVEWPTLAAGVNAIRAAAGNEIDLVVLRDGEAVALRAPVSRAGTSGFIQSGRASCR